MAKIPSIYLSRKQSRVQSRKPSTVATRERELRRKGLSAAILKVNGKWRLRRYRAKQKLKESEIYQQIADMAPHLCEGYLAQIDSHLNELRDAEVRKVTSLWDSISVEKASGSMKSTSRQ